jgi:hypothetical protein
LSADGDAGGPGHSPSLRVALSGGPVRRVRILLFAVSSRAAIMKVASVEFRNYKAFKHYSLTLQAMNVLVGPNNCGKSTVIDALKILSVALRKARAKKPDIILGAKPNGSQGCVAPSPFARGVPGDQRAPAPELWQGSPFELDSARGWITRAKVPRPPPLAALDQMKNRRGGSACAPPVSYTFPECILRSKGNSGEVV